MDSGPSNICRCLIPSNLLQYVWYQGILFSSSFSFCSRGEINSPANSCTSSNTKPPPVHGTHLHYMGVCSPSSVYHQLVPACLYRHAIQGTIHTTRQVMEGYLGCLKRYTVFLLFAKTDTYHLMMVAFTYNNATDYTVPVNSTPEKVQQNKFCIKLICLNQVGSLFYHRDETLTCFAFRHPCLCVVSVQCIVKLRVSF